MIWHKKYDLLQTLLLNMARRAERNHDKIWVGPILCDFFVQFCFNVT
jgi:hypothetical protein